MLSIDPSILVSVRQRDLLAEAEAERLAARLPRRKPLYVRLVAASCFRLARWLGAPEAQTTAAEPADWRATQRFRARVGGGVVR